MYSREIMVVWVRGMNPNESAVLLAYETINLIGYGFGGYSLYNDINGIFDDVQRHGINTIEVGRNPVNPRIIKMESKLTNHG